MGEFDAIDARILAALQQDGRLSNVELAARVGLSPSPCLRRVRQLEKAGVIESYRAGLARTKVGLGLTVFIGIKVDGHRDTNADALQEAIRRMPEVVACHLVSGEPDFLLEVVVPDLAHYEKLLVGTLLKMPMIKDIRSHVAIRTIKANAPLPLGHLAPSEDKKNRRRDPSCPPSSAGGRKDATRRTSRTLSRLRESAR